MTFKIRNVAIVHLFNVNAITRITDHILPSRGCFLFSSCTGIVIYCFGMLSLKIVPRERILRVDPVALIQLRRLLNYIYQKCGAYFTAVLTLVAALNRSLTYWSLVYVGEQ